MLKIQSTGSCIREYRRIPKEWIQDTKCWRYKVQDPVSENTGGYLKNRYRIQNVEDNKVHNPVSKNSGGYLNNGYRIQNVEDTTYKIQDPVSENTGGYLKNGYKIQNAEDTK